MANSIEKQTITFLKKIEKNNNREWFNENKPKYEAAHANIKTFIPDLEKEMNKHDAIEKSKLFRIYRDVRFSKDKTPYKNSFGVGFTRAGANRRGGYYLHIEPGKTFVGGGFWNPNSEDLKRIRKEFERSDKEIRKIINSATFKKYFGKLEGDRVKTAPKGFDKAHPAIDLIRMKSFTVDRTFKDSEVVSPNFIKEINSTFKAMRKYFDYMTSVLTTDLNGVSLIE